MTRRYRLTGDAADSETAFVRAFLERHGWRATQGDDWRLLWSFGVPDPTFYRRLDPSRRVNHFPGAYCLHYKDELYHWVAAADDPDDFLPRTYSMPGEHSAWRQAAAARPGTIWARKPKRLSGGIDIRLFRDPDVLDPDPRWIVQEYIANPLLLPGHPYKHVLRLYVAVTSLDPLVAYLHTNGPVKFTSRPFGISEAELADPIVHLTNPFVQRHNDRVPDPVRCIDMPEYQGRLWEAGYDPDALWTRLREIVTRTLLAHREPMLRVSRNVCDRLRSCFELLGFDIIVDDAFHPWILECNVSPALGVRGSGGSPAQAAQRRTKQTMVEDLLRLVGAAEAQFPVGSDWEGQRARMGGFELLSPV